MELTFIGYALLLIGAMVFFAGNLRHALMLLLGASLFNGSAAILLPALGDSSIPPVQVALAFVLLRILMPGSTAVGELPDAIRANRWLVLFAVYGIASAFVLPRVFAGVFNVYPMFFRAPGYQFAAIPLRPTAQNMTAAFYMLGTLLTALSAWIACRRQGMGQTLITSLVVIAWVHAVLGLAGVALRGTPSEAVLELFRNSSYLQLDHQIGDFVRIRGIFPEASAYAAFGFTLFAANSELWYHSIRGRATGWAAIAMGSVLFFSTSSTAYFALAAYGLFFWLRLVALPGIANTAKLPPALALLGTLTVLASLALIISPALVDSIFDVLRSMTIEKSSSDSGLQRLYWTRQGWSLFLQSYGLGVGPGSFRSSSILFAILGSMGVIGISSFLIHLSVVLQPWRHSTWGLSPNAAENLGGALASAAVFSIVPALVNSATAVPGTSFAILAGASLALRPLDLSRRVARPVEPHPPEEGPAAAPSRDMSRTAVPHSGRSR